MPAIRTTTLSQVTVTTAGTRVPLAANTIDKVVKVYMYAPAANTGTVFIGGSTVSATNGNAVEKGTRHEIEAPGGEYIDVQNIFVDAATSGDKLNVMVLQLI